jgi:hypothetical protein
VKKGPGGANAVQQFSMAGKDLAGIPINFTMGLHNKAGEYFPGKGSCLHSYDTCLVFFGHNTDNLSYLGAEIGVAIGKEHEIHTFNAPTVIALPKGTPYGPITCSKIEKPYSVMEVGLSAKYDCSWVK